MAADENKAVIQQLLEALAGGDDAAVDALVSPGYIGHRPELDASRILPVEALKHFFAGTRAAFPDLSVAVDAVIGEGDMVAARYRFRGTQRGEYHGWPATGKPASWAAMVMARLSDGKVMESWVAEDDLALRGQLGMP